MTTEQAAQVVRWTARGGSIATLAFLAPFILGGGERAAAPTASEWIGLACFPTGVILGLLVGWKSEALGGWITVGSLLAFYVWHFAAAGRLAAGPWFLILASPGALFLLAAALRRKSGETLPA